MPAIDLSTIRIDEKLIDANREHLEKAIGFVVFGERGIPRTLDELNGFLKAEIPAMRTFVDEFVRQYHVPAVYTLITIAQQHVNNAIETGEVPQLLMARNYSRASFELLNGLLSELMTASGQKSPNIHPTFSPTQAQLDHFIGVAFVLAATTNFLGEAVGAAIHAQQETAS